MSILVFSLVICAAVSHAVWNFFSKKASGNLQILVVGSWISELTVLPISIFLILRNGFPLHVIKYLFIPASSHLLYFYSLNKSYKNGDISVVYPIARGTGIVGTVFAAHFLLKEKFSALGTTGIALVILGVLLISIRKRMKKTDFMPLVYAAGVGVATIIYSIGDKIAINYIDAIIYLNFKDMLALAVITPFVFRRGFAQMSETFKERGKYCCIIGYGSTISYLMVLIAFKFANAGYVSASREFSIVIGSILGIVFLKEKASLNKIIGIALVTAGLVLIKLS